MVAICGNRYKRHSPSMSGESESLKVPGMRIAREGLGEDVRDIVVGWNVWNNDILSVEAVANEMMAHLDVFRACVKSSIECEVDRAAVVAENRERSRQGQIQLIEQRAEPQRFSHCMG